MKAVITKNAVDCSGKHFNAGEILLVGKGKDIELKDAKYLVEHGAAEEAVEPSEQIGLKDELSIEEMAALEDLSPLKVENLKNVCKFLELEGYSNLNKEGLIKLIDEHRNWINIDEMGEDELRALAEKEGIDISGIEDVESIRDLIAEELGA